MKYYLPIFLTVLLSPGILVSCKKDNTKDYSASIKDKTWWGQFAYTGKSPEHYSVHFNADSTLTWTQMIGDYAGKWTINGKQLTITFIGNSLEIKADISDDNKLINISDNSPSSEINSGQLIENPKLSLENTVWKGTYGTLPYQLSFSDGLKMKAKFLISGLEYAYICTRSASGAVIKYGSSTGTSGFMGVIRSDSVMKGNDDKNLLLELVKQ